MGIIKYKFLEKKVVWPFVVWSIVGAAGIGVYIWLFSTGIQAYNNQYTTSVPWKPFIVWACIIGFIGLVSIFLLVDAIIQYRLATFRKNKIIKEAGLDNKEKK